MQQAHTVNFSFSAVHSYFAQRFIHHFLAAAGFDKGKISLGIGSKCKTIGGVFGIHYCSIMEEARQEKFRSDLGCLFEWMNIINR